MKKTSQLTLGFALLSLVAIGFSGAHAADSGLQRNGMKPPMGSGYFGSGMRPEMRALSGMKMRGTGDKPEGWSGLKLGSGMRPEFANGTRPENGMKPLSGNKITSPSGKTTVAAMEVTDELTSAVSWMYSKGLTSLSTVSDFKVDNYLTREQAAKFFAEFAEKILGKTTTTSETSFSDISSADSTLKDHIKKAAKMGLLKGTNGKFGPQNKLTRAQAIAIIVRSIDGTLDESGSTWYANYYNKAASYGILTGLNWDEASLNSVNIKRGEVALLLYRLTTSGVVN